MTILIPRAAILEIMQRHNDFWGLDEDPPAVVVRDYADELRCMDDASLDDIDEARELDALVDRVEAGQ